MPGDCRRAFDANPFPRVTGARSRKSSCRSCSRSAARSQVAIYLQDAIEGLKAGRFALRSGLRSRPPSAVVRPTVDDRALRRIVGRSRPGSSTGIVISSANSLPEAKTLAASRSCSSSSHQQAPRASWPRSSDQARRRGEPAIERGAVAELTDEETAPEPHVAMPLAMSRSGAGSGWMGAA